MNAAGTGTPRLTVPRHNFSGRAMAGFKPGAQVQLPESLVQAGTLLVEGSNQDDIPSDDF
jgi:hypothetical protein